MGVAKENPESMVDYGRPRSLPRPHFLASADWSAPRAVENSAGNCERGNREPGKKVSVSDAAQPRRRRGSG